ncbi:hypothetical protein [Methylobacterium sp. Leaf456]|nr:hypothetical protein [Methylobacterium sp. Leaf456]
MVEVVIAAPAGAEVNVIISDVPRVMLPHAETPAATSATARH